MKAVVEANAAHLVYCVVVVCEVCSHLLRTYVVYLYMQCTGNAGKDLFSKVSTCRPYLHEGTYLIRRNLRIDIWHM